MIVRALGLLFLLVGCQTTKPLATPPPPPPATLSILQGTTDKTSTVLTIVTPQNKTYTFSILFDSSRLNTPAIHEKQIDGADGKILSFTLKGLNPGSVYILKVADDKGEPVDERSFKTFASDLKTPQVMVLSYKDARFDPQQKEQWLEVWNKKPDALFLEGDSAYNASFELYHMQTLLPVFNSWLETSDGQTPLTVKNFLSQFKIKSKKKRVITARRHEKSKVVR